VAVRSRVLLSLPIQLTNYLQMPPLSEEATQAIRARQELQSCLGVHSTALFCTPACGYTSSTQGSEKRQKGEKAPRNYTQGLVC
jgi:hypothetical protein